VWGRTVVDLAVAMAPVHLHEPIHDSAVSATSGCYRFDTSSEYCGNEYCSLFIHMPLAPSYSIILSARYKLYHACMLIIPFVRAVRVVNSEQTSVRSCEATRPKSIGHNVVSNAFLARPRQSRRSSLFRVTEGF
jgi:hypothetical protein